MGKVKNEFLAGRNVAFASGIVAFDADGIGEVNPDELYQEVIKLDNFFAIDGEGNVILKGATVSEEDLEVEVDEKEEEVEEDKPATIDPKDYTEKQLDALAEELEIPEDDYPKSGTKAVKAAAINAFNASK
jgi:hypothetical protein